MLLTVRSQWKFLCLSTERFQYLFVCLYSFMGKHLPLSQIGPTIRTKMTDFTYGTCFTLKCKTFGAPTAKELPGQKSQPEGKTILISGGTPTYLYCMELISQLKQINKPGKCILTSPFMAIFTFYCCLQMVSLQIKK